MTAAARPLYAVVPAGVDDPRAPSGGNTYDRRVLAGLARQGWAVRELAVDGAWPRPDGTQRAAFARALAAVPDDALVLLDGIVASAAGDTLPGEAERLRQVVLIHLPLAETDADARTVAGERAVLSGAEAVLATSEWTRRRLVQRFELPPQRVHVALPGVDPAPSAVGTDFGGSLLCVAAVTRPKGHDVLVDALSTVVDQSWQCRCVGSLNRDPVFAEDIRKRAVDAGLSHRLRLDGALVGADLESAYAASDLLIHPSRGETYGMALAEAIAHGVPVLGSDVGGVREAMLGSSAGELPGMLVEPDDPYALATALRRWLRDPGLRADLRAAAARRRGTLPTWAATVAQVHRVLLEVAA